MNGEIIHRKSTKKTEEKGITYIKYRLLNLQT